MSSLSAPLLKDLSRSAALEFGRTPALEIGQRIREIRSKKGLSVRKLAQLAGISPSMMSHIELGKGAPSVKTIYALVSALDIPLSEIFGTTFGEGQASTLAKQTGANLESDANPTTQFFGDQAPAFVLKKSDRRSLKLEHGFSWECLTPEPDPNVEFMETIIEVGGGRPEAEMRSHNGREYGYVLKGRLGIKLGFNSYVLEPGGSISFDSTIPHSLWNAGDVPTHSIWFVVGRHRLKNSHFG
jgi:transcriptional regulator with XRE-family HTH domain